MKKISRHFSLSKIVICVSLLVLLSFGLAYNFYLNSLIKNDNPIAYPENYSKKISQASICSTGDILLHGPVLNSFYDSKTKTYNFDDIFKFVSPYVKDFDYAAINFEGTIGDSSFSGYPCFKYPASIVDAAVNGGFNLFLTANNHSNDGGTTGFCRTTKVLNEKGVDFTGTRQNVNDKKYIVKDINGIKFLIVNYTYGEINNNGTISLNGIPGSFETSKLINVFDYKKLESFYEEQKQIISDMKKEGVDVIIYYMHWGNEYELKQNMLQVKIAQMLCDLGVDVIIGGHPHVVQPLDVLHSNISSKDTVCLYSMGNAISNQLRDRMSLKTGHTEDGVLFGVSFKRNGDGEIKLNDVSVLPTWTRKYQMNQKTIYQIVPLDKEVDFNRSFNLTYGKNDISNANNSYDRTMKLLSNGLNKVKSLIN